VIVFDASAAVCFLLNDPPARAVAIGDRIRGDQLCAPHLLDLEVAQTLRRSVFAGALGADRAKLILTRLAESPIIRYPHYAFLARIWQLRANLSAYDAAYVSLAEMLRAPLVTLDARMARAGSQTTIEVL